MYAFFCQQITYNWTMKWMNTAIPGIANLWSWKTDVQYNPLPLIYTKCKMQSDGNIVKYLTTEVIISEIKTYNGCNIECSLMLKEVS